MKLAKAFAEIDSEEQEPAETKIKGYMPIGSVRGSGSVEVTAFELVVPSRQVIYHAIRFEVSTGGDYPSEGIASVALEDSEKLLAALESLASVKISTDRFDLTEVEAVIGDLRLLVFNTSQGRLHAAVEASGTTCHLNKQSDLLNVHKLVSLAITHLREKSPVS